MEQRKQVVYIAGAITSRLDTYQHYFSNAQMVLEFLGYTVLNPAWLPIGLPDKAYQAIDDAMLMKADVICLLQGWKESEGAKRERDIALENKMKIIYYKNIDIAKAIEERQAQGIEHLVRN